MRPHAPLRHRIEVAAIRGLTRLVTHAPAACIRAGGTVLGTLLYCLDRTHRRRASENVARCFPDRPTAEQRTIVRRSFQNLTTRMLELLQASAQAPEALRARVDVEGAEHMRAAYAGGRGVLFVSGHFGCWELSAIVHALLVEPVGVLARPLDNPRLHAMVEAMRQRTGNTVIYRQGAVRKALRMLLDGQGVGVLIDQRAHAPGDTWVRFFGDPAGTTSTPAALALRTGAAVVPVFTLPLPGGRFRMIYEPAVVPPAADAPDAVQLITQRCTDVLEAYVRRQPELWLWMHRRWRDAPAAMPTTVAG